MTMGYYVRADLPFYYALADAFTLCDAYHCSILGPTHPNRLMANSGTIDPAGTQGGPVTDTNATPDALWNCTWPTMQEVLQDAGVSWKVYRPSNAGVSGKYASLTQYPTWSPALYNPIAPRDHGRERPCAALLHGVPQPGVAALPEGVHADFPNDFVADVNSGSLPSVSWIIPPLGFDEHPSSSPDNGMYFTSLVLDALTANPELWSRTALFLMYDENDGWFDHVPPPTAPAGTAGEYLTTSTLQLSTRSRTPRDHRPARPWRPGALLVISPFSRGGHIASETFDHTSQLNWSPSVFGVEVPNLVRLADQTVGDLTSALFQSPANHALPKLPADVGDDADNRDLLGAQPGHRARRRCSTCRPTDDADAGRRQRLRAGHYDPGTSEQASGARRIHRTIELDSLARRWRRRIVNRLTEPAERGPEPCH